MSKSKPEVSISLIDILQFSAYYKKTIYNYDK